MGALRSIDRIYFLDAPRGAGSSMSAIYSNSGQIRLRLDVLCANSGYGIASRQPAINRTSAPLPASSICKDRQRLIRTLATAAASSRAPSKPNTPMGPTPDAELHLRAARAEQQVADLNVERNVLDRNTTHRDLPKTYERERGSVSQSPRLEAVLVMAELWSFDRVCPVKTDHLWTAGELAA